MKKHPTTIDINEGGHGTLQSCVAGFLICIALTLAAYFLVAENVLSKWASNIVISALGLIQVFFQLLLFLHLGNEPKPRWNLLAFLFMVAVVAILVFGSLWIMYNLDSRVMPDMSNT